MSHKISLALRLVVLFSSAIIAVIGAETISSLPAFADGAGRVCVFFAPDGASGLGHIGWSFRDGAADHWYYGSTENISGQAVTSANGAWLQDGTQRQMFETFTGQLDPVKSYHPNQQYYMQYSCKSTTNSSVGAAVQQAQQILHMGFNVFSEEDCLTHAQWVLKSYDSSVFVEQPGWVDYPDESQADAFPINWFPSLDQRYGFGAAQPVSATATA
jgi:hypothetical protein